MAEITDNTFRMPTGTVVLHAAIRIAKGSRVVVDLDAKYDLNGIAPEYRQLCTRIIETQVPRISMGLLTQEDVEADARYRECLAKYKALPWYKKLFVKYPWYLTKDKNGGQ